MTTPWTVVAILNGITAVVMVWFIWYALHNGDKGWAAYFFLIALANGAWALVALAKIT